MSVEMLKYGALYLLFGELAKKHFYISPVWCEYHEFSELKDFDDIPKEWLNHNLFLPMSATNTHPYYSFQHNIDYSDREFLFILSDLTIGGFEFLGYVFLVQGRVKSVSVFINDDIIDFLSSEFFSDENIDAVKDIANHIGIDVISANKIDYVMSFKGIAGIDSEGVFFFPVDD